MYYFIKLPLSQSPYGYDYVPKKDKEHGYITINEKEARVVNMIFNWVGIKGIPLRQVVRDLKKLEIKPRKSARGVWNTSTLSTMLRNEVYIGKARWGSSEAVVPKNPIKDVKYKKIKKTSRKMKPKEEWKYVSVPEIIDEDLFVKVRNQLDKNFRLCKRNRKNEYLFSGLIRCSCGCKRTGEGVSNGRHLYYRCTDRLKKFPLPKTCFEGGLNAKKVDSVIWDQLSTLMTDPELIKKQAQRFIEKRENVPGFEFKDIENLEKSREKLKGELDRYHKAYGAGVFSLDDLDNQTGPLKQEISSIENQIASIHKDQESRGNQEVATDNEIEEFAKRSVSVLKILGFEKKREMILNVVDKVIATQSKLLVYGKIPIKNYEYKTISRDCWFAKCGEVHAF